MFQRNQGFAGKKTRNLAYPHYFAGTTRALIEKAYKLPPDNANYPQGLVSCLYQLKSKIPYDFDMVNHLDERKRPLSHLKSLRKNDIIFYDRGYFSYAMLYYHVKEGVFPIFRLQRNLYQSIELFWENDLLDQVVIINPSKDTGRQIKKKISDIKEVLPLKIRLIKYSIGKTTYCIGTTLMDKKYGAALFKAIYFSRWGIEELYKISKEFIVVDDFHGKSERAVKVKISFILGQNSKMNRVKRTARSHFSLKNNGFLYVLYSIVILILYQKNGSISYYER